MKKRIFTLMMLLIAIRFAAEAHPVDLQIVCEATAKFVNTDMRMRVERDDDLQLVTSYRTANNIMALRVLNPENGFVIASTNNCATTILAYSDENRSAYQITAVANPAEGGTISGDGTYYEGDLCTLTAVSNNDYDFVNWTKNGVEVSTDPVYSFMVTENATYTANFESFDGLIIGDGSTNTNYYLPSYSFYCHSLTQQIYTPADIEWTGAILSLGFYNDGGTKTQSYDIYMVNTDKISFTSNYDWIPVAEEDLVFSGTVTMVSGGWTTIPLDSPFLYDGGSNLAIIIDNNTGSYTGSPYMACRVFGTDEVQAIRVYNDETNYDPFNPFDYSGTLYAEKNQIRLAFDVNSSEPVVIPDTLAMGYRPNNAWMSPYKFQIYNPGNYTLINSISIDNSYFQLEEITVPFTLGYHKSSEISLTHGIGDGETTGHLIINYGDNQTVQFDLSAIAYDPNIKDVWETAFEVTSYPYSDSLIVANIPLYNNYNLPPTDTEDGADAVYKLVFTEDALLNASMTSGENGKLILYQEDFNGESGPLETNCYTSPMNEEFSELFETQLGEGTSTFAYFPFYTWYDNSIAENLFLADELIAVGMKKTALKSLSWYATNSTGYLQQNISIWLANVSETNLGTGTSHLTSNMTLVYTGSCTPQIGWNEFEFNESNFVWDGESNLLICVQRNNGSYNSSIYWQCHSSDFYSSMYSYRDGTSYDMTTTTYSMSRTSTRPNIIFKGGYYTGSTITDRTMPAGTYYLVTSSTSDAWGIEINTDMLSCPELASHPTPSDYDTDVIPTAVQLHWSMGERTTEYMLLLGTEYDNLDTIVDWTRDLTETYVVTGLLNNTNYFWQIKERNDGCPEGVEGSIWGFTTLLNGPQDLYAANYYLFEGDDLYLEWTPIADTNILSYNIYQDNEWIGNTTANNYTVSGLTYNMEGYNFHVTAVYAGGESNASNAATVWVSGNGSVAGHVYEQDGITSIENATVTFTGHDEFGYNRTYAFTTDANGYYTGSLKVGTYSATATCFGYQAKHYDGMVSIAFNETTESIDLIMDEIFYPVSMVVASYYPDAQNTNSPYVKVNWDTYTDLVFDFDDSSLQGWTTIDGGSPAGYGWHLGSTALGTGYGHNNSTDLVISQSYDNNYGVIYPDNYLISPQVTLGGSISFYACAQDASYGAEHFGVAVSTTSNTSPSTFTMLQEWTIGAKGTARETIRGNRDQSAWTLYTVDLSAYAGQTGYVAIRHFNCSDQYFLDVDDITISEPDREVSSRSFSHYKVYRTNAYNNGPFTEENTVLLADNVTDTLLIDVTWPDAEPGVYKFGVSCVYEGNRESEIKWGELRPNIHNRAYLPHIDADTSGKEIHYAQSIRAPWDLLATFYAAEGSQYGVASDGVNIYTCNWGYSSVAYNFYKYDMYGNVIEGFNIEGCGTIRDLTYDGQYFYGGSNGSTLYCINLANKQVVSTVNTQCGAIRHCSYDPIYDGFWVGSWSDLMLIDRNGNILQTAVSPSSCGGSGYYQAEDGSCHLYLFCEPTYVYDYDIATNTISYSPLYDVSNLPGVNGYVGGAFIGEYNGKMAFYCDIQQSPNLIGIYELKDNYNSIQGERESAIVWSNSMDKNMYLGNGAVNVTVTLNSGDSPEGVLVQFTNLNPTEQILYPIADITLDATGYYAFDSFRKGEYQVQVSFDDYYTITEDVSIWDATALNYVLNEINYGVSNLYVSRTGWATWNDDYHGNSVPSLDVDTVPAKGNRHFNNYQVELSDTEENVIYQGTLSDCFMQLPTDNLVDGETYHLKVAAVYSSGFSEWQEIDWAYQSCDNFETVTELNMDMIDDANVISWTYPVVENRSMMTNTNYAYVCNNGGGNYSYGWLGFDIADPNNNNSVNTNLRLYGGDYCGMDGYVHGTYESYWYKLDPQTGEIVEQDYLGTNFYDCAWDYTSQTMYAVRNNYLYRWNLNDHTYENIGSMSNTFEVLACDLDGQLWGIAIGYPANLYKIDKTNASLELVGSTGLTCDYYWQSGGFDNYTSKLYWYGAGFFAEVDTETGAATTLVSTDSYSHGTFCVPFNGTDYVSPVTGVLGAMVYRDGELLGFTTSNTYTDSIVTGNHEYAIRVVYDGMNRCPNFNAYYAMSCPLSIGGESYEVTVTANPAQGGVTTGAGTYINGFPCTVTATANENYIFTNWVMDGEVVANTPEYTFRVTDNTSMEANFIGFTPHWEVVNNPEYSPLSLIGIVNVNGEELTGNYMEVAALCGNECRGRQMLTYYPDQNRFLVFMTIYGQDGDDITFSLYNHELGEETEYNCLSHLTFDSEATVGSYNDPYAILFGVIQTTTMQTGWNWYSTIVEQEGNEGLEMLEASLGSNGVMIKSQTDGFDINYNNLWMGNLDFITNDQMYMINTNAPIEAVVSGFNTNVNNHPITLYTGWTWVGYPHTEALDINDALANLTATNGDILKSKQTFSTYIEGQGWYGTLNTLEPSAGMMYHSKKNSNTTFTYSDAPGRMELIPNLTAENNHWIPNDFEYPDNMSVMAVVELNHVELVDGDYELAAFENGKCVGSAKLIYVGPTNRYMAFLTLSGEEDHVLSFGLYDAETGVAYTSTTETVVFTPNAIVGNMDEPFVVHFDEATGINQHDATMTIHPNPADRGSLFSITMSTNETVLIEITNALGEIVSVTSSSQTPMMVKAPNVTGIYIVRVIINGKESYSRKLIVK